MLLSSHPRLPDLLLLLFERHARLSAKEIHGKLTAGGVRISLVAVYKELNRLQQEGVVVKAGKQFHLSLSWILELLQFADRLYQTNIDQQALYDLLPSRGARKTWRFSDLQRMDRFWVNIMFALFEISHTRVMYEWAPHLWFPLVDLDRDRQYIRAMEAAGNRLYLIIGADTFLDRLSTSSWDTNIYHWSHAESPFHGRGLPYFCVIDDFIIRVRLDQRTNREINTLFNQVQSKADLDLTTFYQVFQSPCKATIQVLHHPQEARKLTRSFVEFFGPP